MAGWGGGFFNFQYDFFLAGGIGWGGGSSQFSISLNKRFFHDMLMCFMFVELVALCSYCLIIETLRSCKYLSLNI